MVAFLKVVLLVVGFVLLVKGADFFVDGASGIAKKLKISTFIIGVTVVALGTSAPEMAVTIVDAVGGSGDLIVGNILGSNVINIFLILGVSALVCNLPIEKTTRYIDLPVLVFTTVIFVAFGFFGGNAFSWWEGVILILLYCAFVAYTIWLALKQSKENANIISDGQVIVTNEVAETGGWLNKAKKTYENLLDKVWFLIILSLVGLSMVVGGAQLVVDSAQYISVEVIHLDTEIVALTVVAFGTSLPELVTSVSAAKKGDVGIATGNIIGSNIANILLIGGVGIVSSGLGGLAFTTEGLISGLVSLVAALIILIFAFSKVKSLNKIAGIVMLVCLVAYYGFVFLNFYVLNIY